MLYGEYKGLRLAAVNAPGTGSRMFDSINLSLDMVMSFSYTAGKWGFGIYAINESVDVSAVAKDIARDPSKAGGHKGAAGGTIPDINKFIEECNFVSLSSELAKEYRRRSP